MPLGLAIFQLLLAVVIKRLITLCQLIAKIMAKRRKDMVPDTFAWRAGTPVEFKVRSHHRSLASRIEHAIATGDLMPKYHKRKAVRARLARLLKQDSGHDQEGQSSAEYLERLLGSSQLFKANRTAMNKKNGVAEDKVDRTRVEAGRIGTLRPVEEKTQTSGNEEEGQSSAEYLERPRKGARGTRCAKEQGARSRVSLKLG